jgi:hypothetical protein
MADYATIKKPKDHFNNKLWTGNGSARSITGVGFKPDWVWIKDRDNTRWHQLFDAVRGAGKVIYSNATTAEGDDINRLSGFISDGFSLGTNNNVNDNSQDYVAWNWKASNATAVSNSDGDVTSTVSANQTAGFSIVTVSNLNSNSFGHGLGKEPHLIFGKRTDDVANWRTYFKGISSGKSLFLNVNNAETTEGSAIASANATTVTVTGSGNGGSAGTGTAVYYCFAPIRGYSKIGTYTGNNNSDGVFIYTGFRPAWGMFKRVDSTSDWMIMDDARNGGYRDQPVYKPILANSTAAESSSYASYQCDFVSNGFKVRNTLGNQNASGTYLFMAFAELPLVGDNPAPAR